jgi:vitamin B12 transporter
MQGGFIHATAQTVPPARSEEVIVTASRTAQAADAVLAQVTVITRDDIVNAGPVSLAELLARRANLDIRMTGGAGQTSSVFIRGTNSTHALVLVDGQRISSSTSGAAALEHLSPALIERIEIVRGPYSALYGSDAVGGVIQVFTRNSSGSGSGSGGSKSGHFGSVSMGAGSDRARDVNAALFVTHGDTRFSASASHRDVDAPSASNPAAGSFTFNPDRDPYRNRAGNIRLSHTLWQGEQLSLSLWQSDGRAHFDSGPGSSAVNRQKLGGWQVESLNTFVEGWQSRLSIGETRDDSRITSSFPSQFRTAQKQVGWQNTIATRAGDVIAGLERREEKVTASTNYTATTRKTDAAYFGVTQRIEANTLAFNVRQDREDQFGERTTGAVTWGHQWTKHERFYLTAGKAFRAPSFNDLYFPGFSNPKLTPEKSDSGEFGWRFDDGTTRLDVAVFENRINDLIVFDSATSRPQNIRRARIRGWELAARTTSFGIDWRASVTAQNPQDTISDKQLRSRAKLLGNVGASTTLGRWQLGADISAASQRFDSTNEAPASRMGGYALLNAYAKLRIDRNWSVEVTGSNLTNTRYELAKGYNTPRRQVLVGVRLAF